MTCQIYQKQSLVIWIHRSISNVLALKVWVYWEAGIGAGGMTTIWAGGRRGLMMSLAYTGGRSR